jgi:hypothetical protein
MVPELRAAFNAQFTPEKYTRLVQEVERRCGTSVSFRISETPCFFPTTLLQQMERYGAELVSQIVDSDQYRRVSDAAIPPEFNVPQEAARPMFVQVDFGLVRNASGELEPKLVELQGFPSVYAFQSVMADAYREAYELPVHMSKFLGGIDEERFAALMRECIVGRHDPAEVVLLEVDPFEQKTLPDFLATKQMLGIEIVNIRDVVRQGRKLGYPKGGKLVPIRRIYNRAIAEELVRKNVEVPFDFRDEFDVEWAGHPNWYFRMSKFSIPYLKHECVPETHFLDELERLPQDRSEWLLKPLFSFAGAGILFEPSDVNIASIPAEKRHEYILQRRMRFEPVIATPHGMTQAEIRIMYLWPDGGTLTPVLALIRMGRGKMMGVDHNKNLEWVGASAAFGA